MGRIESKLNVPYGLLRLASSASGKRFVNLSALENKTCQFFKSCSDSSTNVIQYSPCFFMRLNRLCPPRVASVSRFMWPRTRSGRGISNKDRRSVAEYNLVASERASSPLFIEIIGSAPSSIRIFACSRPPPFTAHRSKVSRNVIPRYATTFTFAPALINRSPRVYNFPTSQGDRKWIGDTCKLTN